MIPESLQKPIPLVVPSTDGWKEIPIIENGEKLVPLGLFSENDEIFTSSVYAGEKSDSPYADNPLKGGLVTVFVREGVAQSLLPVGINLVVVDTYRPLDIQQAAFDFYFTKFQLAKFSHNLPMKPELYN